MLNAYIQSHQSCSAAPCPNPVDIVNGMVTFIGNSVGDTATYTCNPGFDLNGISTTTCTLVDENTAEFSPPPPICRREYIAGKSINSQTSLHHPLYFFCHCTSPYLRIDTPVVCLFSTLMNPYSILLYCHIFTCKSAYIHLLQQSKNRMTSSLIMHFVQLFFCTLVATLGVFDKFALFMNFAAYYCYKSRANSLRARVRVMYRLKECAQQLYLPLYHLLLLIPSYDCQRNSIEPHCS